MNKTLLSLAIVKTNWEHRQKDHVDNFVPLVSTLILEKNYSIIDLEELKKDFQAEYGLLIPSNPLISVLSRMSKSQLLKKDTTGYVPELSKLQKLDIRSQSSIIKSNFNQLINKIKQFGIDKFEVSFSDTEIEEGLISFLADYDIDILFASQYNTILPKVANKKNVKFLINKFISSIDQNDIETSNQIVNITVGHALSASILYEQQFQAFNGKVEGVEIYLDTPIILCLLGFSGQPNKIASTELITNLKEEKAILKLFDVNYKEVHSLLDECHRRLKSGRYDLAKSSLTLRFCVRNKITTEEVSEKIVLLEDFLEAIEIEKVHIPEHLALKNYQIDEPVLYKTIVNAYQKNYLLTQYNNNYNSTLEDRIWRDVTSISAIYRLRGNDLPVSLKKSKAIFVTTNSSLAFAARKFDLDEKKNHHLFPACITDVFIGTLLWMQSPAKVNALNKKKIIADCYAAIQPDEFLIKKYLTEIERLKKENKINEEQFLILRAHKSAYSLLEAKTFGDPEAFSPATAEEIAEQIIYEIKTKGELAQKEEEEQHLLTKNELEDIKRQKQNQEKKITDVSIKAATKIANIIFWISLVILVFSVVVQFLPEEYSIGKTWKTVLLVFAAVTGFFDLAYGADFIYIKSKLIEWISTKIQNQFK